MIFPYKMNSLPLHFFCSFSSCVTFATPLTLAPLRFQRERKKKKKREPLLFSFLTRKMSTITESYRSNKSVATYGIADQDRVEGTQVDAEQQKNYEAILELLLAAGYFRARIKGLRPFDKVIGGLTWSIMNSAVDLDVDLFFEEGAKLGQEIKLGEDIIRTLRKMKCPHPLQSNQIRGLDCVNIFPVVQWLVKKVIETREEMGDVLRTFSVYQFHRSDQLPSDREALERAPNATSFVGEVGKRYQPERKFRTKVESDDIDERVQIALLEYGDKSVHVDLKMAGGGAGKKKKDPKRGSSFSASTQAVGALMGAEIKEGEGEGESMAAKMEEEQKQRIDHLMKGMDAFEGDQSKVSGARVGDILNFQSGELMQVVQMHQEEHEKIQAKLEEVMSAEDFSATQHKRQMEKRAQKMAKLQQQMEEIAEEYGTVKGELEEVAAALEKHRNLNQRIVEEIDRLNSLETPENSKDLKTLKGLVALNESLKQQEKDFRSSCGKERKRLQELLASELTAEDEEELQRIEMIDQTYQEDVERLNTMRSLNAKKTRDIVMVKRKIDEIPSRTESTQYQQALLDLYEQVDAKLNETRQYFSTYNTLSNTLEFWHSEVQLMESISGNYKMAMKSDKTKDVFLKQLQQKLEIVEGNIKKANEKLVGEKAALDEVKKKYGGLLEKERAYYKATKEFQEECALNERLQE